MCCGMTTDELEEGRLMLVEDLKNIYKEVEDIMFNEGVEPDTAMAMYLEHHGWDITFNPGS